MHYYAIINEEYVVMEVVSSATIIDDPFYIEITEEQYNDEGFIGYFYDQDKNDFVGFVTWMATSNEVRYDETYRTLTGKLNEMDEEIATHTHDGYVSSSDLLVLEDIVNTKADANHTHSDYAATNHTHDDYATQVALDELGEEVEGKANAVHSHTEYALASHEHNGYAEVGHDHDSEYSPLSHGHTDYVTTTSFETLESEVDGKASSTHTHTASEIGAAVSGHNHDSDYADINHSHDSEYSALSHSHTNYVTTTDFDALEAEVEGKANVNHSHSNYSEATHNHDSEYSSVEHDHDEEYSPLGHSHNNYATVTSVNELTTTVSGKADTAHAHDDRYYTETEIDAKLATKADSSHNHTGVYDVNGAAASALTSANAYTDSKIDAIVGEGASETLDTISEISAAIEDNQDAIDLLNSAIGSKANVSDLTSHANDTEIHVTDAERESWNAKSNFSGNYNDLVNKPTIPSINGLATEDYVDGKVAAVTVESIGALPNTTVIPTVPTNVSAFTNDAGYLTEHQSLNGLATETYVDTQIGAIDIPSSLSDLTTDSTHRVVTDAEKSTWNAKSNFSGNYNDLTNKPSIPSISGLATETYVDEAVSGKANSSHTHDDRYYTETEINTKLSTKSDSTHNHNTSYDVLGAANTALTSAKEYTDDAIADEVIARDSAIATAKSSAISTAASDATTKANNALASAKTYADSAVATAKNDLLNGAGTAYDTLKELGDLIDDNVDAIEALETVAAGKANASHTHAISDVTNLQSTLDGKAATSHGTHVSYSTTAPVMDGSASVGTASTVARSDHKHPTDTSRAAQTSLDSHTGNKSNPHGVTLAQLGVTATAAELNYVDGVTSNVQTQLNGKAASGHTHGAATTSAAGFMTAAMVTKLNGIATGANAYSHPTYTARTGVPTANQTPAFGGTFTVSQPVSDGTGHITAVNSRTITIPSAVATASANGLMSKSDKSKLDGMVLATVSEVETYLAI